MAGCGDWMCQCWQPSLKPGSAVSRELNLGLSLDYLASRGVRPAAWTFKQQEPRWGHLKYSICTWRVQLDTPAVPPRLLQMSYLLRLFVRSKLGQMVPNDHLWPNEGLEKPCLKERLWGRQSHTVLDASLQDGGNMTAWAWLDVCHLHCHIILLGTLQATERLQG